MSFEEANDSGVLFKNDRKEKPNQPDYTGTAKVASEQFRVSAWIKTSRDGSRKFLSLAFQPRERERAAPRPLQGPVVETQFDDDIPF